MRPPPLRSFVYNLALLLFIGCLAAAQPPRRIVSSLATPDRFVVQGNTPHHSAAIDQGPVHSAEKMPRMSLHFRQTPAQQAGLAKFLQALQLQDSPDFHHFLTPEQYADRFGINSSDMATVAAWLSAQGFGNLKAARSQTWISFTGTAAQAESAFHTAIHRYSLRGKTHLANATEPSLPKALEGLVDSIRGLNDFHLQPNLRRVHPHFTSSISGNHFLAPDDWETIYDVKPLYGAGIDGTGINIAIAGQSDVLMTDIDAFRSAAGLPPKDPTVVIPTGDPDPGIVFGDETESDLDLEWSGAIAKNANILFVTSGYGVESSIAYAIDNNLAPVLSISYGLCEAEQSYSDFLAIDSLFQEANAQGITVVVSSGDAGATACDAHVSESAATLGLAVSYPASSQYVTSVGGTEFSEGTGTYWDLTNNTSNGSAMSYIPEIVWNDGFQSSGGGGASILVPKPGWQSGPGVPNDGARDLPDIAVTASGAHDGILICNEGWCTNGFRNSANDLYVVGGTSAGAPSFAGLLALVVENNAGIRLGNINPNLYSLAQTTTSVFHDITSGNNEMACQQGTTGCPTGGAIGYSAAPGYDQASGLGSIDANNFSQHWADNFKIAANPASLTIQPGNQATATVTLTPVNNFSGTVSFACVVSPNLFGVTCSMPPTTLSASGTTFVAISASGNARLPLFRHLHFPPGRMVIPLLMLCLALVIVIRWKSCKQRVILVAFLAGTLSCGGGASGPVAIVTPPTAATLTLSCALPAGASVNAAYSASCTGSGGTAPLVYSVSAGTLPSGLAINSTSGTITGTPTLAETSAFTIQVSDSGSPKQSATAPETLTVAAIRLSLNCSLPAGTAGSAYFGVCSGAGGTAPLSYSIGPGTLPAGLALTSITGIIAGYPTAVGTSSFTVNVADSESPAQMASQVQTVNIGSPTPLILEPVQITANVGTPFSLSEASYTLGGSPPYSYSLLASILPAGLSLDPSGVIYGTPTQQGTSSITVAVTDRGLPPQTASAITTLVVGPALPQTGTVTITATSGGIVTYATIAVSVP